jgi:hypothetical protein
VEPVLEALVLKTGVPISTTIDVADGWIILFDPDRAHEGKLSKNLLRLRTDGSVMWEACPPSLPDIFIATEMKEGRLLAWTWSGFLHTIDAETGKIEESTFTK